MTTLEQAYEADQLEAEERLILLVGHGVEAFYFAQLEGPPIRKQRPRVVQGHAYTPKETEQGEFILAHQLHQAARNTCIQGSVALVAVFYMPTRRGVDVDNLLKLVLDAGNKASIWLDDRFVRSVAAFIEYDPARPRTLVAWCATTSSMDVAPKVKRG